MKSHSRLAINSSFSIGELRLLRKRHKVEYYKHNLAYSFSKRKHLGFIMVNCDGAKLHTKQITFDYCERLESFLSFSRLFILQTLLFAFAMNASRDVLLCDEDYYVCFSFRHGIITLYVWSAHRRPQSAYLVEFIGGTTFVCRSGLYQSGNWDLLTRHKLMRSASLWLKVI